MMHWSYSASTVMCLLLVATASTMAANERYATPETKLRKKLHIDLTDPALEANANLDLAARDPADAAHQVLARLTGPLHERLARIYKHATSPECRALIGEHFGYFLNAIATERSLPFTDFTFENQCPEQVYDFDDLPEGMHFGMVQNRTYQPENGTYVEPHSLKLCYAVLTHDSPKSTIRLIDALYEPGHIFVIHVDGKETSEPTYQALAEYASLRDHVHILAHPYRVRVNWGGFSMVNATMQILQYLFQLNGHTSGILDFDKVVHIASTSYPIASNAQIRKTIASYPLDANLLHIVMKPTKPHHAAWHYFVECDDRLHRLYRLKPLTAESGGIELYTSSQWFIISRDFAYYLALAKPGTLVHAMLEYTQHVVVADESFFGTILRNSPFCETHHNWHFLHLQFDKWESDLDSNVRDERKCMMPDPNHCGRSPTTMTSDYLDILEMTGDLFARKFDPDDDEVKDVLDAKRAREDAVFKGRLEAKRSVDVQFEGNGVLIVAKDTIKDKVPLCMGLGDTQNKVRLVPCFYHEVLPTLAEHWETGAVIEVETMLHNRWEIGPCSSDGNLTRLESADMVMTPGDYSPVGPRCMFKQLDGLRAGRCVDGESEQLQPGGPLHVFPCVKKWNQFLSVGNGTLAPRGSLHTTIPRHIVARIQSTGYYQESYMCVGVLERGDGDEEEWSEDVTKHGAKAERLDGPGRKSNSTELAPLSDWNGEQLVTTKCSNSGAVIEWIYVPFIVEDPLEEEDTTTVDDENMAEDEEEETSQDDEDDIDENNTEL